MKKQLTATDKLVNLINLSTLSTEKLIILDELGKRESSELAYIVKSSHYDDIVDLFHHEYYKEPMEIITLYHSIKVNGKVRKLQIDIAGAYVSEAMPLDGQDYHKFEIRGIVIPNVVCLNTKTLMATVRGITQGGMIDTWEKQLKDITFRMR